MAFDITLVPDGPYRFGDPVTPPLVFGATGAGGPVEWSVSEGVMVPVNGDHSTLNPLNLTRTMATGNPIVVTAKDTSTDPWTVVTKQFDIEATFPLRGDYGMESDINPGFEASVPEAGPPKFRLIPRSAQFPFTFKARLYTGDYAAARDFLIRHEALPFWVVIPELGELRKIYQDSALRRVARRMGYFEYAFQGRDYDYQIPANVADAGPFVPAFSSLPDFGSGEFGG